MRTRNAETPKPASKKKTPQAKKSAGKAPQTTPETGAGSVTPKSTETKRVSATKGKQVKTNETTPTSTQNAAAELNTGASVEEVKTAANVSLVTPETKAASGAKSVVKKTPGKARTPPSVKAVSAKTPELGESLKPKVEEPAKKEGVDAAKEGESTEKEGTESAKKEGPVVKNVEDSNKKETSSGHPEGVPTENPRDTSEHEEIVALNVAKSPDNGEISIAKEVPDVNEQLGEEIKHVEDKEETKNEQVNMEAETNEARVGEDAPVKEDKYYGDEVMDSGDEEGLEEPEEELPVSDAVDPGEETEALEEEHRELTAIAKERKISKAHEIFVGGLDRDAEEEDVKKVFERIGEVVEVRLHKNLSSNKNKGYAFVKFANKEHASRALSEMKNPVICGKRCGTAPSEDNNTLFLGNICNTWTKEAIKQKLKDYGIEGVGNITLVPNPQHEGLSRGFAFLEFSCHADAMLAYKRLQKPDVIFGHAERTAKVAFAEPLREPDPEIMAQVKSVFVDGLPPHWDEDRVREQFKGYGEIERIVLARNMSTAKRKDFGFVDFTTHEAALSCIDSVNNTELCDGNSKTKVKVRLSNPLPKTQAVKGGLCGGFRIGHGGVGSSSKFGRGGFGRGGHHFNRAQFQRDRGFYQREYGPTGRLGFPNAPDFDGPYPEFHERHFFGRGGRRGSLRGAYQGSGGGYPAAVPPRPNLDRPRHGAIDRGHGKYFPFRQQPFFPEEDFDNSFSGRHFDDPYLYEDNARGIKRPFIPDWDPGYMEPSRFRPRLDYSDPEVDFHGSRYRDNFEAGSSLYSQDYYGPDYDRGAYPSYYRDDRSYRGGYYY